MLQSFNKFFSNNKDQKVTENDHNIIELSIEKIIPNSYQPRTVFNEEKIVELARTFQTHGIIQPIVVRRKEEDTYEIIAGERRYRAAKHLEWERIPAIIKELSDTETASIALIENIQREDLSVIEEAIAYKKLMEMHELTQEALAQRMGKSQSTIANKLRLLLLPDNMKDALSDKRITERHARALMRLKDQALQIEVFEYVLEEGLTVKETELYIKSILEPTEEEKVKKKKKISKRYITKDIRLATNTIRDSLKMIKDTGIDVESEEVDLGDFYQITIKVKKEK